ncbi:glycosyl hydrolase family 28-related protein, partial [Clostridium beijerinckii]
MSKKLRDNFNVRISAPIDTRFQCVNLSDIDRPYEGLKTYQLSDHKFYKYINGEFIEDNNDINNSISQINTKLSNNRIFNVLDFGAKGDGTTDDTNAFNSAL